MDKFLYIMCNFLSCFAVTAIMFQFMNSRYKKSNHRKYVYALVEVVILVCVVCINLMNVSLLKLVAWFAVFGISAYFLYYEDVDKPLRRMLECEALMFCMVVCESLGVFILRWILQAMSIKNINAIMLRCLEVTFSALIIIFFYYMVISRLMKKSNIPYSKSQYVFYSIILGYSFINMLAIIEIFKQGQINYLCMINMGCIVLADLYLLYFVKMADEKNYYENQVKVLEQQAKMQYEYYLEQTKKYDKTVQILHDVKKHIKAIEDLYLAGQEQTAGMYMKEIGGLLKPLIPTQYTGNPILNILLTDKEILMKDKGISMEIKIDNVSLEFIEPIDVTTIFGNLLDNAIEAAEKVEGNKWIYMKIGSRHQMIVIRIENSCNTVRWKNDMPMSRKGKNGGIGLLNVKSSIEKYDGYIKLKQENQKFIAELFLNS
ncbi:MAG: GHKL domain-containing protein [Lachnospiraceae bacterium]|nr:GHKL domain-containing protein [Lachnospiraceae bacterium]